MKDKLCRLYYRKQYFHESIMFEIISAVILGLVISSLITFLFNKKKIIWFDKKLVEKTR